MTKTMAGVLAEHSVEGMSGGTHIACRCNRTWVLHAEYRVHLATELSAAGFGLVADAVVVQVHHHDIEEHAKSFNEGYETAMAQELADDPTTAQDWLDDKLAEAKAEALLAAADALDKLWGERKDKPDNGWRDWADGVEEAESLVRELAAKEIHS